MTPLVLVALLFAVLLAVGVAQVGRAASLRASAQAAADASALAGAADGQGAAGQVAAANHAVLRSYRTDGTDVVVSIERRGATATARARWQLPAIP